MMNNTLKMLKNNTIWVFLLTCAFSLQAQNEKIELQNPSFEDMPRHSRPPMGWFDCGMDGETPPDVQPGSFEVFRPAQDGQTYLGLVTRDNETWEAVGQRLSTPFVGGRCYQFKIHLTYSDQYFSPTKTSSKSEFFIKPVKLRVWGGNGYCDKRDLLGESEIVKSTEWEEKKLILKPKKDYKYIVLEAFYKTPTLFPYNGNLLVDNASPIVMKDRCDEEWNEEIMEDKPLAINEPKKNTPKPKPNKKPKPKPKTTTPTNPPIAVVPKPKPTITEPVSPPVADVPKPKVNEPKEDTPKKETITPELGDISKLKQGQTIRIQNLAFKADDDQILASSKPSLDEIYDFLKKNPSIVVEIGGHTNSIPSTEYCNRLSNGRAKSVRKYLIDRGLAANRITAKGYGKTQLIDTSRSLQGRKRNQRVEIKIIDM